MRDCIQTKTRGGGGGGHRTTMLVMSKIDLIGNNVTSVFVHLVVLEERAARGLTRDYALVLV